METVLGKWVQDSTGVVEEFKCLVAGVGNGRGDLQLLQTIDIDIWDGGLDGQARGSKGSDRRGDEGDEGSMDRRGEHFDASSRWVNKTQARMSQAQIGFRPSCIIGETGRVESLSRRTTSFVLVE